MAINEINDSNFLLLSNFVSRQGNPVRRSALQPDIVQPQATAAAATPEPTAIQLNALLINETLRNLDFASTTPADTLLFNQRSPFLTALQATQELNIIQQNTLQINETLQNLNFVPAAPTNSLLINETPPALEASEILPEQNLNQQNEQLINDTLLDLDFELSSDGTVQPLPSTAQDIAVTEEEIDPTLTAAAPQNDTIILADTGLTTTTVVAAAQPTPLPTPTVATTGVTIPVTATFLPQQLTPSTLPFTLFPDRTPYVHVVYQLKDPAPPPGSPEPINKEVPLATPVTKPRALGDALLRQILRRGKEKERTRDMPHTTIQATIARAEKHIRYTLDQVNSDMAAHGLPLHLVFAMHEDGVALDVYDCSYNEGCLLSYDIPIELDKLTGVLDNLQHETGIIVDTKS